MRNLPNIVASHFRRGQYIGYGAGTTWRIVKRTHDWYATPREYGWWSGFASKTLSEMSEKLEKMQVRTA